MKCVDPATMSTSERIGELGELLASGVQRYFARECKPPVALQNSRDQLDVVANDEAPCPTNSMEAT